MPILTQLERGLDICFSQWKSPDGRNVSEMVFTPITEKQIMQWLAGGDPPRPVSIPIGWLHVSSHLEYIFTNGRQEIGPNEMGDVSGYEAGGMRAPEIIKVLIQEPGDKPIELTITSRNILTPVESKDKNNSGKFPSYTIINGVATKVSDR